MPTVLPADLRKSSTLPGAAPALQPKASNTCYCAKKLTHLVLSQHRLGITLQTVVTYSLAILHQWTHLTQLMLAGNYC